MAAAVEIEEKLKDITDCPICLETFKEPKILPCIHSFCMHCLRETGEKLNRNPGDTMPCPVCRKEFTVPETGFVGLQKNFFMDKLTEIKNILQPSSAPNLCDPCREDNESLVEADIPCAEMYCVQCQEKLCGDCYKHHRKQKLTKNHKIISIEGFKPEDIQESLKTDSCEKHPNSLLEIYCSGCQEVVCAICFVEDHQSHVGSDINKVATEFRSEIKMNVDEFSSFLPQLRQEKQELDKHKAELLTCMDEMQTKICKRRQELKELVERHAGALLLELDSIRQQSLKKWELNKENIETLLVYLESYTSYCLQITTVGSASDICRAKTALDARTNELKHIRASSDKTRLLSHVRLNLRDLQDRLWSPEKNVVGEFEEYKGQNLTAVADDDCFERPPVAKAHHLQEEGLDMEKLLNSTPPIQNDDEDVEVNGEIMEFMERKPDTCAVTDSIELKCLSELEILLRRKLKDVEIDELSIQEKLKVLKQRMMCMSETINGLHVSLENEQLKLKEVEKERDMLVDHTKEHESSEQKLSKTVEDLESQVVLLNDLVYGGKQEATKTAGTFSCSAGVTFSANLERLSNTSKGYEVFGMALLDNELFVVSSDNITVVYDLPTLNFRRRWKVPREGTYDDMKQCDANNCLFMMKVDAKTHNEIIRVDPNGNELSAWSVDKARGQLSVTSESNILLTVSSNDELHEYAPDGRLVQIIHLPWNSGIEKPVHALKLTSDHFLVCHGNVGGPLVRVCVVEKDGNVLKYFGELWKTNQLACPVYLDRDGAGNILVVDQNKKQVLLLGPDLKLKRSLITHERYKDYPTATYPKKVCFDESNGRVLMVEHVTRYSDWHNNIIVESNDTVSVFKV